MTERFSVRNEQLKVARIGLVDRRIVDFIHDSVREREPKCATRVISSAETILGAVCPLGLDPGRSRSNSSIGTQRIRRSVETRGVSFLCGRPDKELGTSNSSSQKPVGRPVLPS